MGEETKNQDIVPAMPLREGQDTVLAQLAFHCNVSNIQYGLTLLVGGIIVSGLLVSGRLFLEDLADQVDSLFPELPEEEAEGGEPLSPGDSFRKLSKGWYALNP